MEVYKTISDLRQTIENRKSQGHKVVLVPTMGALHIGHLELVKQAKTLGQTVVCSIFVNPTQFNDPEDLKKYPRPIEKDISQLESVECDILFLPEVDEIYTGDETWFLDLGYLDQILEGQHRPGHFQGVTQVVYKLFDIIKPDMAVFGLKDLQQYRVVQRMVELKELPVQIIPAPIVREEDGLAMSSRNVRLTPKGRKRALILYQTLQETKANYQKLEANIITPKELVDHAINAIQHTQGVDLEYFEIRDLNTLNTIEGYNVDQKPVALVAAWVDGVRLIDNLVLKP